MLNRPSQYCNPTFRHPYHVLRFAIPRFSPLHMPAGHSLAIISAIRPLRLGIRTQSVRPLSSIAFLIFASTTLAHRTRLSVTRRARKLLGAQRKNMVRVEFLLVLLRVFKYCSVTAQRKLPSVCRIHQPKQMLIFSLVISVVSSMAEVLEDRMAWAIP